VTRNPGRNDARQEFRRAKGSGEKVGRRARRGVLTGHPEGHAEYDFRNGDYDLGRIDSRPRALPAARAAGRERQDAGALGELSGDDAELITIVRMRGRAGVP
jgi:hypothetical protein